MFSYIYMKILEARPYRYDRGISRVSRGQSEGIKHRITDENVEPGSRVLEIGCGTGTLAILAAKKGAEVTGFDVSPGMLSVAREKIANEFLEDKIELHEMGVSGMDTFPDECFDLVASTLVFSELSHDEQVYALRHARRVLKTGGRIAVADEVVPESAGKRILHLLARIPLLIITFVLTQTTTRAVRGLEELVSGAGFGIETAERSSLDSFLYLVGVKEKE